DSGFDEAAGNAQASNFGRGGVEGDRLRVETQDYSGTNNANMSTPSDGLEPRMQVYVWSPLETHGVTITPGDLSLETGSASFGPASFDVTGAVVLAAGAHDACTAAVGDVAGRIVLVDRGSCTYAEKVENVQ